MFACLLVCSSLLIIVISNSVFDTVRRTITRIIQIPSVVYALFFKEKYRPQLMIGSASLSLSPDAQYAVVNDSSMGGFSMYSLRNGELVRRFKNDDDTAENVILPVSFIHNGKALMTGGLDGLVRLWDTENGVLFSSLEHHNEGVYFCTLYIEYRSKVHQAIVKCFSDRKSVV